MLDRLGGGKMKNQNQNEVHFGLAISKELNEKLKSLADADKRSKSAYVRIVLEEHVKAVK